jgi:hypothetical protein
MIMVINMNKLTSSRYVFIERSKDYVYSDGDRVRLRKDIRSFLKELTDYNISLRKLSEREVSYTDRNKILNIALDLINNDAIAHSLVMTKKLPMSDISENTGYPVEFIKVNQNLIVAYMLLFGIGDHSFLARQLSIGTKLDRSKTPLRRNQGIKLKDYGVTSVVLTPFGEFLYLDPSLRSSNTGDFITGSKPIVKPKRAMIFATLVAALIFLFIFFAYTFYQPVRSFTVMGKVEASFSFNRYGRMVEAQGLNSDGRSVLADVVYSNKTIDSTLARFLAEALDQNLLTQNSELTLIVVEGYFDENEFKGEDTSHQIQRNNLRIKVNQGDGNGFILSPIK